MAAFVISANRYTNTYREKTFSGMIFIPSFIKISKLDQTLLGGPGTGNWLNKPILRVSNSVVSCVPQSPGVPGAPSKIKLANGTLIKYFT